MPPRNNGQIDANIRREVDVTIRRESLRLLNIQRFGVEMPYNDLRCRRCGDVWSAHSQARCVSAHESLRHYERALQEAYTVRSSNDSMIVDTTQTDIRAQVLPHETTITCYLRDGETRQIPFIYQFPTSNTSIWDRLAAALNDLVEREETKITKAILHLVHEEHRGTAVTFYPCRFCGKFFPLIEHTVCPPCADTHARCAECRGWFHVDEGTNDSNGTFLCDGCQRSFYVCERCGCWIHRDEARRDNDGNIYCDACYEDRFIGRLHSPHCYPSSIYFLPNPRPRELYLGIELETDNYDDINKAIDGLSQLSPDEKLFWLAHDGSLEEGIEIISCPCTLEYHQTKFPWGKVRDIVIENGGKSHNAGTCGLHIHISKDFLGGNEDEIDEATKRLCYLFEKFWGRWIIFSRRNSPNPDYARRYREKFGSMALPIFKRLKGSSDRYQAINITNPHTIEFRIFRGTLHLPTFFASLELTDFLARLVASNNDVTIHKLTWKQLITLIRNEVYPHLLPYIESRQLLGKCPKVDVSSREDRGDEDRGNMDAMPIPRIIFEYSTPTVSETLSIPSTREEDA